ncbi:MAG: siphovirus ReqiPepy6 Gp37-like family protein [Paludibacter sp.]|nr:siphovirus ReqiPepy6 Gp37-like family protein [Paludibacter sp.]
MEIIVLNTDFESVDIVDSFKSMIWTDRYNSYGDFEMYLTINSDILKHLKEDYYLWLKDSEHCMIIEDSAIDSDTEDGNHLIVTGRSLESILERRIIWGQKVLTGNLQLAIQTLLNDSIISPTIQDRKIDNFIFEPSTDPRVTELTVDAQFTGDDLYVVIKKLCQSNNLGFKIVLNDNNQFVFSLYAGADRSYNQNVNPYVVFSPDFENIINSNYFTSKANLKNVTLVAGEGEGASRKTTTVGSGSGLNRRELFTDARDISSNVDGGTLTNEQYIAKLKARGIENLSEYTAKTAFEGEVEATRLFKYGEDFFIGDIVQIANEYGHEGRAYISELIISQSEDGVSIYPTFQTIQEEGEETE